ncbi:MAG: cation:proton antiporter [Myxacorys chilensis ATA2-1-KO14]|jgi:Kef-type K+ transport system membrane component KefB/nucleotide-binding universal stress UspA family protein|nr:cation:proton antiporter [Myxacorys chilensis ATA2-1-KO14]
MINSLQLLAPVLLAETSASNIIKPLGHHELLLLLLQLSLLLLASRGLGELMRRVSLPPVVGELLAGVLLGPSIFGLVLPAVQAAVFPKSQTQSDLLSAISWLGVLFLLIVTGLETDLNLIVRKGRTALVISLGGIIVPFITGLSLGWVLPDDFLANPSQRFVFSLFIATAMSISAVPVIAKVLMDLQLIRRDIGQVTLAAGMTDDTLGWILLSVVSGLATSGTFDLRAVVGSISGAVIFLGVAFTLGRTVVDRLLRWVDNTIGGATASLSIVLILALGMAALTHSLGIEAALGAFVLGILAGQSRRFSREAGHILEVVTAGFLAPIFFASAGLKVNLVQLLVPQTFIIGLVVLAVACVGKFVGAYIGSRVGGLSHWEGLAIGSGMNARGAMEIIVATIGLSLGVLNQSMYSIIVMVAIVTSLMAPPLLRWTLSNVVIGEEEAQRLQREEHESQSFIKQIRRILMPTSGGANVQLAAQLVSYLGQQNEIEVTALYALDRKPPQRREERKAAIARDNQSEIALNAVLSAMNLPENSILQSKVESGRTKAEVILNEARKGYDLIVMGASEQKQRRGIVFNMLVDQVVQEAPCATLVVKSHLTAAQGEIYQIQLQTIRHILVPTAGSEYSRNAIELASTIAAQTGALVSLIHVVTPSQSDYALYDQPLEPARDIAYQVVKNQAQIGELLGAKVMFKILEGKSPERTVLEYAQAEEVDLIVLGTNIRIMTGRVFFGHRVDTILNNAECPVALLSMQ